MLKIKKVRHRMTMPTRGSSEADGLDLYAAEPVVIPPGCRGLVPTGFSMSLPYGLEGHIRPRSGNAARGITVDAGTIDSDYRGEVMVLIVNHSSETYKAPLDKAIAQMVVTKVEMCEPVIVKELDETGRGGDGFGSTDAPEPPQ